MSAPSGSVDNGPRRSVRSQSGSLATLPVPSRHILDAQQKQVAVRFLIECPSQVEHDFASLGYALGYVPNNNIGTLFFLVY